MTIINNPESNSIKKALSSAESAKPLSTEPPSLQDTERWDLVMATLWQRMAEIFGQVWELNYGKVGSGSMKTWSAGLDCYSENQIRAGVGQCKLWDNSFPPNLGQFSKLCATRIPGPNHEDINNPMITHLKPHASSEVAKHELGRMFGLLKGKQPESRADSYEKLRLHARWGV